MARDPFMATRGIEEQAMAREEFALVTSGEMLKEEFLIEYELSYLI